jgi:uncharacterized membrane protein
MKRRRLLFYVFSALGVLSAAYATRHWFLLEQGAVGESACNINEYWNCDKVSQSPYGAWLGIPIGVFGLLYWAVVILASMLQSISIVQWRLLFIPPLLVNLALVGVLFFDLQLACITCYVNYIAWLGAAVAGWRGLGLSALTKKQAGIVFAVFLAVIGSYTLYEKRLLKSQQTDESALQDISPEERARFASYFAGIKKEEVPLISPLDHGSENAQVVVVEFSDFGCPHCARAATQIIPEVKKLKDVRVVFYPLPIDPACHPKFVGKGPSNGRCEWAKGVLCAAQQNKEWEYHDFVFRRLVDDQHLPRFSFEEVESVGLERAAFEKCFSDTASDALLKSLIELSIQLDIQGTPTFFVNGRRFRGLIPLKAMLAAVVEARKDVQP